MPFGKCLRCDFRDSRLRLPGRIARRGTAIDVGGQEAVVAHCAFRAGVSLHAQTRQPRHHSPRCRNAPLDFRYRRPAPNCASASHAHRVGAAESVEVIGVERAKIDLQRFEDVGHRPAVAAPSRDRISQHRVAATLTLWPRTCGASSGAFIAPCQESLGGVVRRLIAQACPILELQLEAADCADACHGRRREHCSEGLLNPGVFLVELDRDGAAAQFA